MSMANTPLRENMRTIIDPDSIKRAIVRSRMIHMLALAFVCVAVPAWAQTTLALDKISMPPGFKIEVLVRLENPRASASLKRRPISSTAKAFAPSASTRSSPVPASPR